MAKVRTLVRATHNGSQQRLMYAKLCANLKMSNNNLLELDCPTRWNSTYDMLRAAIEKRAILDEGTSHFKTNGREMKISKDEWELLRIFTELLVIWMSKRMLMLVLQHRHQCIGYMSHSARQWQKLGHWFGLPTMVANDGLCTRNYALTELLEPFSFATQHVCQTVTPTITHVLFILQV